MEARNRNVNHRNSTLTRSAIRSALVIVHGDDASGRSIIGRPCLLWSRSGRGTVLELTSPLLGGLALLELPLLVVLDAVRVSAVLVAAGSAGFEDLVGRVGGLSQDGGGGESQDAEEDGGRTHGGAWSLGVLRLSAIR